MGDSIIRNTESSWAKFANYLTDTFKTQYGNQSNILNFLTSKFQDMVNNPQGFSPQALSALRGGSVDQISKQFQNARTAVAGTAASGNMTPDVKSGVGAQISGQIAAGQAGATAGELNNIELQNEQQRLQNQRIGLSGLSGVAAEENPLGYSGAANGAAGTTGNLGSQYFSTDQSGFFDVLGRSFASGLGSTLSGQKSKQDGTAAGFFGF